MTKKVLFARIGRMKYYQGHRIDDQKPVDGGSHNIKRIGAEIYNFMKVKGGNLYGYIGSPGKVSLHRIDAKANNTTKSVGEVMVIFIHRIKPKGQVIVGWYDNATVYKELQHISSDHHYHVKAKVRDAVFIPMEERLKYELDIGKDIGRTNRRYRLDKYSYVAEQEWMKKALRDINGYTGSNLLSGNRMKNCQQREASMRAEHRRNETLMNEENEQFTSSGQGRIVDYDARMKIEEFAMCRAKCFYRNYYRNVKDVSGRRLKGEAYDILCTNIKKNKYEDGYGNKLYEQLKVEVKGTQTKGKKVILTRNEVDTSAREEDGSVSVLFITHSIRIGSNDRLSGGDIEIICPWNAKDKKKGALEPTYYSYRINDN